MQILVQEDKVHTCAPNLRTGVLGCLVETQTVIVPFRAPPLPLFKEDSGFMDAPQDNRPHCTSVPCPGCRDVDSSRLVISKVKPGAEVTPGNRTRGSRCELRFLKRESDPEQLRNPSPTLRPPGALSLLNPRPGLPGLGARQL